jgi:hypothetical protein
VVNVITTGSWIVKVLSQNLPRKFVENLEKLRLGAEILTPDFRIWRRLNGESVSWRTNCSSPIKKFPTFYGSRKFITLFTTACHSSRPWAELIQSTPWQDVKTHCNTVMSSRPRSIRDTVVGIATRLRAGWSGFRIPAKTRDISVLQNAQTDSGAQPFSYYIGTGGSFGRLNRPGRVVNHSRLSIAEVKYEWSYASTHPLYAFMKWSVTTSTFTCA